VSKALNRVGTEIPGGGRWGKWRETGIGEVGSGEWGCR